jgi:hypothetical protein
VASDEWLAGVKDKSVGEKNEIAIAAGLGGLCLWQLGAQPGMPVLLSGELIVGDVLRMSRGFLPR